MNNYAGEARSQNPIGVAEWKKPDSKNVAGKPA